MFVVIGVHKDTLSNNICFFGLYILIIELHMKEVAMGERAMDDYTTNALFHNLDTSIEKVNPY